MKFERDRRPAVINLAIWTMAVIWILVLLAFLPHENLLFLLVIGSLLLVCLIVIGVSPLLVDHEIADGVLHVRQGWHSRVSVPLGNISRVQTLDKIDRKEGVVLDAFNRTLVMTDSKVNGVRLELREEIRVGSAFWKRVKVIIFDVRDPERFVSELKASL